MSKFIIEFFEKSDGTYPAEEFILSQNLKMKSRFLADGIMKWEYSKEII